MTQALDDVDRDVAFDPATDPNPQYPYGLCMAPTINLSSRTPYTCEASGGSDGLCPGAADTSQRMSRLKIAVEEDQCIGEARHGAGGVAVLFGDEEPG